MLASFPPFLSPVAAFSPNSHMAFPARAFNSNGHISEAISRNCHG